MKQRQVCSFKKVKLADRRRTGSTGAKFLGGAVIFSPKNLAKKFSPQTVASGWRRIKTTTKSFIRTCTLIFGLDLKLYPTSFAQILPKSDAPLPCTPMWPTDYFSKKCSVSGIGGGGGGGLLSESLLCQFIFLPYITNSFFLVKSRGSYSIPSWTPELHGFLKLGIAPPLNVDMLGKKLCVYVIKNINIKLVLVVLCSFTFIHCQST